MYELTPGAVLGATVLGSQIAATRAPVPAVAEVARAALPVTGIGFGTYLAVAVTLLAVGWVLRRLGRTQAA